MEGNGKGREAESVKGKGGKVACVVRGGKQGQSTDDPSFHIAVDESGT